MKRYRNEDPIACGADQRRHVTRHRPRNGDLAGVFEADRKASRQLIVSDRGARARNPRRPGEASAARCLVGRLEWKAACPASGVAEEVDLDPASGAKAMYVGNDGAASGAARRQREIQRPTSCDAKPFDHGCLSLTARQRTSGAVPALFDMTIRALRRDRAARQGAELFLYERSFADCLERIALMQRTFERALLIGCPDRTWPERLRHVARRIDVRDPGLLFAVAVNGETIIEDNWVPPERAYDLVVAIGTLDSVNEPALALRLIRYALQGNALLIGVVSGGETLPRLRGAMRAADTASGGATPHVHPRIEAAALAPLLEQADFVRPVVDVDRVNVAYRSLHALVADLRGMASTNVLMGRPRFIGRPGLAAAVQAFVDAGDGGRTVETFEILHFAAWTVKKG